MKKIDLKETEKNLTADEFCNFKKKLEEWEILFAVDDQDLGHTDVIRHGIQLTDTRPFK